MVPHLFMFPAEDIKRSRRPFPVPLRRLERKRHMIEMGSVLEIFQKSVACLAVGMRLTKAYFGTPSAGLEDRKKGLSESDRRDGYRFWLLSFQVSARGAATFA